jgi:hypothetical protein
MTVWTHKRETFRLYSLIAGKVAEVTRCGNMWRATVWHGKGSSSLTADYSREAKEWAEYRWKQSVRET